MIPAEAEPRPSCFHPPTPPPGLTPCLTPPPPQDREVGGVSHSRTSAPCTLNVAQPRAAPPPLPQIPRGPGICYRRFQ